MRLTVDYYLAPHSPWTYLGHRRFAAMARAAGAHVNVRPVDLGQVFPATGGLALAQRSAQRRAYRLVELHRFSTHLQMPLKLAPRFFPVDPGLAARLLTAVAELDGSDAAMDLIETVTRGVWAEDRDIADSATLATMLEAHGLPRSRLDDAAAARLQERYLAESREAIERGVFGAPTYVVDGELFWGQDRLDFVQRRLDMPG